MLPRLQRKLRHFDYKKYLKANRSNVMLWCSFFVFIIFAYHFLSDGDFSFFLTLSSVVSAFGFGLVLLKSFYSKSVAGVSVKSMECYAIVYLLRLITILRTTAYLPYDRTGDWFYQLVEVCCLIFVLLNIYLLKGPFKYTHTVHHDTWGTNLIKNRKLTSLLLIGPSIILALIVRPQRSANGFYDFCWAASMYLESVSILPQLHMFKKNRTGEIEPFTSHFVFSMFVSKLLNFMFWLGSWKELNGTYGFISSHFAGFAIILSQICQLGLMGSYVFYYIRAAIYDSPMILPTSMDLRADFVCLNLMGWQKVLIVSTVGLCCAYAGFVFQEKWIHFERTKREQYVEQEVNRRLQESSPEENPSSSVSNSSSSTPLQE